MYLEDTIVAISTALGQAGIGIVRLSGNRAVEIADTFFKAASGGSIKELQSHAIVYGYVVDPENGKEIDEALVTVMRSPRTYTREDIVEINCHSGAVPLKKIVAVAINQGARIAEAGEFTKRAFLNGRIDLAQAEAVIDLIRAQTDKGYNLALGQLEGKLSCEIGKIRERLVSILAHLEAAIDFPEEDLETLRQDQIVKELSLVVAETSHMLCGADKGIIYREGLKTVIIGRPNVGKSSLLNALLRKERAIVTAIPGTTRDIIEEGLNIRGIPLRIMDTAGIREPEGPVEEIGVGMATKTMEEADLILCVVDQSLSLSEEDKNLIANMRDKKSILVLNKSDLPAKAEEAEAKKLSGGKPVIKTCALTGIGLEELEDEIESIVFEGKEGSAESVLVCNIRHQTALEEALISLKKAENLIREGESEEIGAMLVRESLAALGKITGETTTEDLLDRIFSEFCIGK